MKMFKTFVRVNLLLTIVFVHIFAKTIISSVIFFQGIKRENVVQRSTVSRSMQYSSTIMQRVAVCTTRHYIFLTPQPSFLAIFQPEKAS